jgi:hypothetical protein
VTILASCADVHLIPFGRTPLSTPWGPSGRCSDIFVPERSYSGRSLSADMVHLNLQVKTRRSFQ